MWPISRNFWSQSQCDVSGKSKLLLIFDFKRSIGWWKLNGVDPTVSKKKHVYSGQLERRAAWWAGDRCLASVSLQTCHFPSFGWCRNKNTIDSSAQAFSLSDFIPKTFLSYACGKNPILQSGCALLWILTLNIYKSCFLRTAAQKGGRTQHWISGKFLFSSPTSFPEFY